MSQRHDVGLMRQRIMEGISLFAEARQWHGRDVAIKMHFDSSNEVLTISGGRHHLPVSTIRFITLDLDQGYRREMALINRWASQFSRLIIVVDAKELLESPELRHEVTSRRLAQSERYFDVEIMLMDVECIMNIEDTDDYDSTYIGVSAAFGSKPYNGSRLKKVYQEQWNEVYSLGLAQNLLLYRRRYTNRPLYLPMLLICHSDQHQQMGYQELLFSCINQAVKPHSLTLNNSSTYNTVPTMDLFKYDYHFLEKLVSTRFRDSRNIRMAVIGLTSSGKTYLLADFVAALEEFGFKFFTCDASALNKPNAAVFLNQISNYDDGIWKTDVYAGRPTNQYLTLYTKGGERFLLEFVDIPGEVITRDSINEFDAILNALIASKDPIFKETTWKRGNGQVVKTIEFLSDNNRKSSRQELKDADIQLRGNQADEQSSLISNTSIVSGVATQGFRSLTYVTNEEVIKELREQRYKPVMSKAQKFLAGIQKALVYLKLKKYVQVKDAMISGQHLLEHLEEYVTDTVINAIIDAWEALGIDQIINTLGVPLTETYNGKLKQTDSNKERFEKVYKNHFYFHYYTYFSTDIVLCDKCAVPYDHMSLVRKQVKNADGTISERPLTSKERDEELERMTTKYWDMVKALKQLLSKKSVHEKNLYLAFRGVDSFIDGNRFKELHQKGLSANTLYSLFVMHLFASLGAPVDAMPDANEFWRAICSTNPDAKDDIAKVLFQEYRDGKHDLYIKPNPNPINGKPAYYMTSSYGLHEHLKDRIRRFSKIPMVTRIPDTGDTAFASILGNMLPPHVYFTSTPIDRDFNICGHDMSHSVRLFTGNARHEEERFYFGTRNLVADMLLAHGIHGIDDVYGKLLAYCYQNC